MGLNITVHSYLDELDFGLISCRELVPDLWDLVDLHIDEIDVLIDAAGVDRAASPPRELAATRRGCRAAAKKARARSPRKAPPKKARAKQAPAKKAPAKKAAGRPRALPRRRWFPRRRQFAP